MMPQASSEPPTGTMIWRMKSMGPASFVPNVGTRGDGRGFTAAADQRNRGRGSALSLVRVSSSGFFVGPADAVSGDLNLGTSKPSQGHMRPAVTVFGLRHGHAPRIDRTEQ